MAFNKETLKHFWDHIDFLKANKDEVVSVDLNDTIAGEAAKTNADLLGGVDAEEYALKTDTASDSEKLGGKVPEYYLQPRNLLDNSDFTNPVNQRGKTTTSANEYFIDRWTTYSAGATYTITNDGLTIDATSLSSAGTINQYIPKLKDGSYTVAIYDILGNVLGVRRYTVTNGKCTLQGTELSAGTVVLWYSSSSDIHVFELRSEAGNIVTYKKVALYEGEYTAETLQPYVPKGYCAELMECKRYFQRIFTILNQTSTNYSIEAINLPIAMRYPPTITLTKESGTVSSYSHTEVSTQGFYITGTGVNTYAAFSIAVSADL